MNKKLKRTRTTETDWGSGLVEIRTQTETGEIDKKMIDTRQYAPHQTFTPGLYSTKEN